jgi:hypothetical protein
MLEYGGTIQHPDTDVVMKHVHGVLAAIAHLVGYTPVVVAEVWNGF